MKKHNYDERGTFKILQFHFRFPECDLTDRRVIVDRSSSLPVRSHSGIDTFCLPYDGSTLEIQLLR